MKARPAHRWMSTSRNHRRKSGLNECSHLGRRALHVGSSTSARLSLVPRLRQRGGSHRSLRRCLPDFGFHRMAGHPNHAPFLERFALERNIAAAAILGFLGAVPVFRFLRLPGHLLASSLLGWFIFSLSYRALCLIFHRLSNWHSTFQVFMLGAVVYMILTTLCWIVAVIWRAREAHTSHPNHHAS